MKMKRYLLNILVNNILFPEIPIEKVHDIRSLASSDEKNLFKLYGKDWIDPKYFPLTNFMSKQSTFIILLTPVVDMAS
jgi:hypothetical protein